MKRLTVIYDGECGPCDNVRQRLAGEMVWIELEFLALQHPSVAERFPGVEHYQPQRQLVVVADTGEVYCGACAWLMVLYATREYRGMATRLSDPALRPLAREACEFISNHRMGLSKWTGKPAMDREEAFFQY